MITTERKRGTYCESTSLGNMYIGPHPCEKKNGLRKIDSAYHCTVHAQMALAKRRP